MLVDAKPEAIAFNERLGFVRLDLATRELGDRQQPVMLRIEHSAG